MHTAAIRTATHDEAGRLVSLITIAFVADPAMRWLYPRPERYLAGFTRLVHAFAHTSVEHGEALVLGDFSAGALWIPPGAHADEARLGEVIAATVDADRTQEVFEVLGELERYHPTQPHWYLPFIAVDTPQQGRGLGSTLLRDAVARMDHEHRGAYLETANPRNVSLYERHGFEVVGKVQTATSPAVIPMVRAPR